MAGTRSKQPTHSGEGHLVSNLVTFVIFLAIFMVGLYSLTWLTLDNIWPMVICLALATFAYLVPFMMGRSDSAAVLAEGRVSGE
ncbi:hypothetical protein J2M53_12860 [Arthrobacter sp. zg-ZUI100]|uniref:Uncharacterized protein n=1 Tax=Arthrobacter jiangjiafuii TaxID=2817475 RepID=A0A975M6P9_9MICC|nr:hypothetical protein [Arthrobacter jiangjiafuii]MBP3037134.1 hypothetical protein [Arthrobacter jiangjiafuii]MBP3043984.1 hypothetical protein [Arthrobacter jiangjiafuii]QWC10978.1 hypothetical protein KKR91_05100 [Arthrobacter jiangjiafuii]